MRNFLKSSEFYDPVSIYNSISQDFMLEEAIITIARNREYERAFDICFDDLEDPYFAESVCTAVY